MPDRTPIAAARRPRRVGAALATLVTGLAFAAPAAELPIADAGGITLAFEGDMPPIVDGGFALYGALTIGVGDVRTALLDADVQVTLVDGRVDTLLGTARVVPGVDGILDVAAFGDLIQGRVGLMYGDQLEDLGVPLQPGTRYVFVDLQGGPSGTIGPMSFAMGAQATLVLDPADPAFYVRGAVDGLSGLRGIEEAAIGISAHGRIPLAAEHTWGLEAVDTALEGHVYVAGRVEVPRTPLILDGEALIDADPDDDGVTLFHGSPGVGLVFNGAAEMTVEFGPFPGFELPLASASAGGTIDGDDVDVWFSGESGLDLSELIGLPFAMHNQRFVAGRMSSDLGASFVQVGAEAQLGAWRLAEGVLTVAPDGARLAGEIDLAIGRVALDGAVDGDGYTLTGTAEIALPVRVPRSFVDWAEVPVNYVANAGECGTRNATTAAECGADAAVCGYEYIADGVECGWSYIEVAWCWLTDSCDREPKSCPVWQCDIECELPDDCSRDELEARNISLPDLDLGTIQGSVSVTVSDDDFSTVPDFEYCPFGGACQLFDLSHFELDGVRFRMCGSVPGVGARCFDLCDLPGVAELPGMAEHCADEDRPVAPAELPIGVPVDLRIADAELALHVGGARAFGAVTTLGACARREGDPACQWIIEPSPTRDGAFYLRSPGTDLCLHMHGGNQPGSYGTLRTCDSPADRANYQYRITASPTRDGAFHIRAVDAELFVHAEGGSHLGTRATLNGCGGTGSDHGNCQWRIAPAPTAQVPTLRLTHVYAGDSALMMQARSQTWGSEETLAGCAANDPRCHWVFEPSPTRPEHFFLRSRGTDLCLHMHGGNLPGSYGTLRDCASAVAGDWSNYQFTVEPSPTREGQIYIRAADAPLYLHAHGGIVGGQRLTLHGCPKENDHPNCQWRTQSHGAAAVPARRPIAVQAGDSDYGMQARSQTLGSEETLAVCDPSDPRCQWVFEPSPTRPEHYFIRSRGTDLCLHMHGGLWPGSYGTLRECAPAVAGDWSNYQYAVERSPTRADAVYIKVADADLYVHASGGIVGGQRLTLHGCPKQNDHPNCQWRLLGDAPAFGERPVRLRAGGTSLAVQAASQTWGSEERLSVCEADDPRCQWVLEPSPNRAGHVLIRSRGTDLCLHMHGGGFEGAHATLRDCATGRAGAANDQYVVQSSPSRSGQVYIKMADVDLYLHAHGGAHDGARITLHGCPKDSDFPNCQWSL